jgi:hypothetical protein
LKISIKIPNKWKHMKFWNVELMLGVVYNE